jgi:outer membrane protein TolC
MALTFLFVQQAAPQSTDPDLESSRVAENTENAVGTATLQGLIKYAVENNPGLKAARLEWARVIQKYPQVTSLEDPMLTYTYPIEEIETRLGPQDQVFMLSQRFPFPGKLGLKGEVVSKEVEIAKTSYDRTVRDLIVEVKKSYFELYYIDRAISLAAQNMQVLEHFTEVSTTDYAADATALNDVVKAQSQYAQANYDLLLLKEMHEVETTRLNTLLNRNPDDPMGELEEPVIKELEFSIEELYKMVLKNEELRMAELEVEKDDLEKSLSKYTYYPNFNIGLNYSEIDDTPVPGVSDSGQDALAVTFGINIPLWFGKNRAAVEEAELKREASSEKKDAIKNELLNKTKKHYFMLTNSERLVMLYAESLVPQAQRSMEIAETWYESGEGSLAGLLETQTIFYNFQIAYFRSVADYLKSLAELERLTGRSLY